MNLDRYLPRNSPVHRLDARVKFLAAIGFILCVSLLPFGSFTALAIAWLFVMAAALAAHIAPWRIVRGAFLATPFILAAFPLIFTRTGDPLGSVDLGPVTLTASGEGLRDFLTIACKSWVSVQMAVLLTFTTRFQDLLRALRQLRLPVILVAVISFMYRYLSVLTDEATRMLRARAARSAEPEGHTGGGLLWRIRVVGHMVGALFIRAFERSERIYGAMQARGYDGHMRYLDAAQARAVDWATLATLALLFAAFQVASRRWLPIV